MLNDYNNVEVILERNYPSLTVEEIANNGSFACRRPVGSSYYDEAVNKTFLVWSGPSMDLYVKAFNHDTKSYEDEIKVYENNMTNRWDYHNYPSMIKAPNGKTIIFYARHTKELYQVTSGRAHALEGEWERKIISTDQNCYPAPVVCGNDIYLFYSRNDDPSFPYRTLCYIKSKDSGETWSEPRVIIDNNREDYEKLNEVYLCGSVYEKACGKYPDRIQLTWTMWGGERHAAADNSAYFAYFSLEDGLLYGSDGKTLGRTIYYRDMETKCKVEKIQQNEAITHTIASILSSTITSEGQPIVVYGCKEPKAKEEQTIRCAIWNGERWDINVIEKGTWGVKDIYTEGDKEQIKIAFCKGNHVFTSELNKENYSWAITSATKIPFNQKANSIPYLNFVDNHKEELQLILGQMDKSDISQLYEGIWSVMTLGIKGVSND